MRRDIYDDPSAAIELGIRFASNTCPCLIQGAPTQDKGLAAAKTAQEQGHKP